MIKLTDKIKRLIIRYPLLSRAMHRYYRLKGQGKAHKASEERKHLSPLNYKALSKEIPFDPEEVVIDNNLYGYAHHLKKFAGINQDLRGYMEHGLFWGGIVHEDEKYWHYKRIITLSKKRKGEIESQLPQKKAIPVGPYIHYAEDLFDESDFARLKKELGKVLLVFPTHSIKMVNNVFDQDAFIDEINRIKGDYDTVLVSIYYLEAQQPERVKAYEQQGYKIVTAGHRYDHHFVARQKAIINLADMTMSNSVGTHTGWCVYLKKPHYIYLQKYERVSTSIKHIARASAVVAGTHKQIENAQKEEIGPLFTEYRPGVLTEAQYAVVAKYWGFDCIKTKAELKAIFEN